MNTPSDVGSTLPKWHELMQPVLDALKKLGGSGTRPEVVDQVATDLGLSEEQLNEVTPKLKNSRFAGRVGWARFYLTTSGHIDSGTRGVWVLTEEAKTVQLTSETIAAIRANARKRKKADIFEGEFEDDIEPQQSIEDTYLSETLEILKSLSPSGFERLSKRLLRESGFQRVTVTGGSGDEGIDGFGVLRINDFMSFQVYFQCKRYKDIVTPAVIRDFRGAMQGRADKGIILTTGRFTAGAEKEAVRDGVPPIELVNGEEFVMLLGKYRLGLQPKESYSIEYDFFDTFR